jgi:hypothetical protein
MHASILNLKLCALMLHKLLLIDIALAILYYVQVLLAGCGLCGAAATHHIAA